MKVADYIIDFFAQKGIDKAFVVYGAANGDLIDAFTRNNKIQYVSTMHEQAAGFAAEGFGGAGFSAEGFGGIFLSSALDVLLFESVELIFVKPI